jgi:hypothetical protein
MKLRLSAFDHFNTNFEYKLENVVTDSDERELLNAILFRQIHTLQGLSGIVVFLIKYFSCLQRIYHEIKVKCL